MSILRSLQTSKIGAWLGLIVIILIEYYFFHRFIVHKVIPNYPSGIDQANYLYQSYSLYEQIRQQGLFSALTQYPLISTSFLFPIQAALFFLCFGASRLSAMCLNFLYFAILQLVAFDTIKALTQRYLYGFVFIGMLLGSETFFLFGGAADFRIDFMAMCLYGIWICFILRSGIFNSKKWVIASAFLAVIMISMRFLTLIYVMGIIVSLLLYYLFNFSKNILQIKHILLFSGITGFIIAPLLWIHRHLLFSYYIIGHITGPEKLMRAKAVGVTDFYSNLAFYPSILIRMHITNTLFIAMVIILFSLCGIYWLLKRIHPHSNHKTFAANLPLTSLLGDQFIFLAISIFVPLFILTLDLSKATIPPGITIVPFFLLFVLAYWLLEQEINLLLGQKIVAMEFLIVMIIFGLGVKHFYEETYRHNTFVSYNTHPTDANRLINRIGNYAASAHWQKLYVTSDVYTDFLAAIPSYYYETHRLLIDFTAGLGGGSQFAIANKKEAINRVEKSNIFITKTGQFSENPLSLFEESLVGFQSSLKECARKNMVLIGSYEINHSNYQVYAKPTNKLKLQKSCSS